MTSRTVTIEFTQLVLLLCLVIYTSWVWCKSFNVCPKNYSEEYIALHQKYTDLLKEHKKTKSFMSTLGNTKIPDPIKDENDLDLDLDFDFNDY